MKRVIATVESCFRYLLATLYVFAAKRIEPDGSVQTLSSPGL